MVALGHRQPCPFFAVIQDRLVSFASLLREELVLEIALRFVSSELLSLLNLPDLIAEPSAAPLD
jgi:hypothetical protein